ncbi:MAG: hypothetical protein U1F40_09005 [Turneriella sp.]
MKRENLNIDQINIPGVLGIVTRRSRCLLRLLVVSAFSLFIFPLGTIGMSDGKSSEIRIAQMQNIEPAKKQTKPNNQPVCKLAEYEEAIGFEADRHNKPESKIPGLAGAAAKACEAKSAKLTKYPLKHDCHRKVVPPHERANESITMGLRCAVFFLCMPSKCQ